MKKENLRRIKDNIESRMIRLSEQRTIANEENRAIDKKISEYNKIKSRKVEMLDRREEIIDTCKNALVSFLEEEENNKKLLAKLDSRENIFNSGAKFFKMGKEKLKLYDHDKVNEWHDAEEDYLESNRRLHSLHIKLKESEEYL